MDEYIGFDIDHKHTLACVVQAGRPDISSLSCLFLTCCQQGTYSSASRGSLTYSHGESTAQEAHEMSVLRVLFALIRNILTDRAELVTENLALRQQLAILHTIPIARDCASATASSGLGYPVSGRTGEVRSTSCNPKRRFDGASKASSSTGDGSRDPGSPPGPRLTSRSAS